MSALKATINEFKAVQQNFSTAVPSAGATITPGASDAEGSWTDLFGGTVTHNSYGISVVFSEMSSSGVATPTLADIGIDASGGTTYTTLIPDLNAAHAITESLRASEGLHYYFPLFIPAGARLACRAQQGAASAATFEARVTLFQKPTHPESVRVGSWVRAIGIDQSNSRGTALASIGNGTEGAWESIGSPTRNGWWVQVSASLDSAAANNRRYYFDWAIGTASVKRIFYANQLFIETASETWCGMRMPDALGFLQFTTADTFYVRGHCHQNPTATVSAMVYVLG